MRSKTLLGFPFKVVSREDFETEAEWAKWQEEDRAAATIKLGNFTEESARQYFAGMSHAPSPNGGTPCDV